MPNVTVGDASIYYEESGSGYPLLILAGGALNSVIDRWSVAAINPLESFTDDFHIVAMDQRNAGRSSGPLDASDPWGSYADDQLGLMSALGFQEFLVLGFCIGCSFALKLSERAPERIAGAVLCQPMGWSDENKDDWSTNGHEWLSNLLTTRPNLDEATGESFLSRIFEGDFVFSVPTSFVASCTNDLLVMPGIDRPHPNAVGTLVGELAPRAETIAHWKETPEQIADATVAARNFLLAHLP